MRSGPHRAHCRGRDSREVKERSPLADLLRLALLEAGRIMKAWSQAMFKLNLLVLAKLNIPHFNVICNLLGSFISTFFYKYMWPQTSRSHVTRLQRSHAPFAVHVWTSGGAGTWTSSTLFLFLFESSHVCPINICEVRSFLYYQSVWDAKKPIFQLHFVYEMKDLHLCVIQDGGEHVDFFQLKADVDLKSWKSRKF